MMVVADTLKMGLGNVALIDNRRNDFDKAMLGVVVIVDLDGVLTLQARVRTVCH